MPKITESFQNLIEQLYLQVNRPYPIYNQMSKSIYYLELTRKDNSTAKFKFAIDNAKTTIKEIKQELRAKLLNKKQLQATDEIVLKDTKDFELCSDDEVDDVLPEPQKNVKVFFKNLPVVQQPVVQQPVVQQPVVQQPVVQQPVAVQAPVVIKKLLKQSQLIARSGLKPHQQQKHDEDHMQIKFTCPQFNDSSVVYSVVTLKKQTHYELSQKIVAHFDFEGFNNLKAVLYYNNGQPLVWAMDYMGAYLPEVDLDQTFTVIFTTTYSIMEVPVNPLSTFEQKHNIFVKLTQPIGFKVDLEKTTVGDLKVLVFNRLRIHPQNQIIKSGIKILQVPTQALHVYGVTQNSLLEVIFKVRHRINSITFTDNFYNHQLQPLFTQSQKGLRTFRSNLLVVSKHLPLKAKTKLLALLRYQTNNNALVNSLSTVFSEGLLNETQKIALEQGLFNVFYKYVQQTKDFDPAYPVEEIFTLTRQILGYFVNLANSLKDSDEYEKQEFFRDFSSSCDVTLAKIEDPVYVKLDNNNKIVTDRLAVLTRIKNNIPFSGVASLHEGCIMEDKQLKPIYSIFKNNSQFSNYDCHLKIWSPKVLAVDYLVQNGSTFKVTQKYDFYINHLGQIFPNLKIFNPLELKHKVEYIFLLKDKAGEQKIYVGKGKDIHTPHTLYDVITGGEIAVNFDILGGAAKTENLEEKVNPAEIKAVITRQPQQAIAVLIDISGSMGGKFFNQTDLNRMGAVKSFFEAFSYRTMAYNFQHVISLILFDNRCQVACDFTQSFQDFNRFVANANPRGGTNLYDAIASATVNLINFKKKYPNCLLRILALTDGEDTGSRHSILDAARLVTDNKIILDSFVVGSNCQGLKCITFAAGGKCYLTRNIEESLKLFEQETVISYRARKAPEQLTYEDLPGLIQKFKLKPFDMPNNVHQFKMPEIQKPAVNTQQLMQDINDPNKVQKLGGGGGPMKRILKEFANYQTTPHPFVAVFPCGDMTLWKILLLGPKGTPYEGGLFLLYAKFPEQYPFKCPQVRFITPIYHCNMNSQGRICHSVFDRNYSPAITFKTIIDSVYGLILTPEPDDPLDNVIATYFLSDYQQYYENAVKATKANASKNVQDIVEDLFGKITDDNERQKKIEEIKEWKKKAQSFN